MSPKPTPSRSIVAPSRVSSGIPWWLCLILVIFGISIAAMLVRKAIPEDPQMTFEEGMDGLKKGDIVAVERSIQKLKNFPDRASELKLLEGMLLLGKSKPMLAIPLLQDASKNPAIRVIALTQLGNAYIRSQQRVESIAAYESALQEDQNMDEARLNLARIYKNMISWEDAIKQLTILVERKFAPGDVQQMLGDIYADMGQYAEAATAYEAAILVDPTNPTNSETTSRLLMCRIETGNVEGLEELLQGVDAAGVRESTRALILAGKDEIEGALSALDLTLIDNPNDLIANQTYGKIMAKSGSKEKSIEALTSLQLQIGMHTHNLKLFEVVAELAKIVKDEELAATAQQNVDQLKDLKSQFLAKLGEVVKTREEAPARVELGDLAAATGQMELARTIYLAAGVIEPTLQGVCDAKILSLYEATPPLVPLRTRGTTPETVTPADQTPGPTPEQAPEQAPN